MTSPSSSSGTSTETISSAGTTDESTQDHESSTSAGVSSCGEGFECAPPPPEAWAGPALVLPGGDGRSAECLSGFPDPIFEVFSELDAPAVGCGCSCGPAVGASCAPFELTYFAHDDEVCEEPLGFFEVDNVPPYDCSEPLGIVSPQRWELRGGGVSGSCEPSRTTSRTEVRWRERHTVCGGVFDLCSSGLCVPRELGAVCIWTEAETTCPTATPYTAREVYYTGIEDTRECSPCGCEIDGKCTANVHLNAQFGCSDAEGLDSTEMQIPGNGVDCSVQTTTLVNTARVQSTSVPVSCVPTGGEPVGDALATGPRTFCCIE